MAPVVCRFQKEFSEAGYVAELQDAAKQLQWCGRARAACARVLGEAAAVLAHRCEGKVLRWGLFKATRPAQVMPARRGAGAWRW